MIVGLLLVGCFSLKRSVRPGRSELKLVYLTDVSQSGNIQADLKTNFAESKLLLIVDDAEFSSFEDLAWWEGEREVFMLGVMGCDLFFPPSEWRFLGPERLYDLSSRVEFFMVALDLVDENDNYPLSRYMIRQHSPYRLAFSAAIAQSRSDFDFKGVNRLPMDSILPITASLLELQTDFFIFFDTEDSPAESYGKVHVVPRGGDNRILEFQFRSRVEFKLKEEALGLDFSTDGNNLSKLWQAYADSLDAQVIGVCEEFLTSDSLRSLALKALVDIAEKRYAPDTIGIFLPDGFIAEGIPAGEVAFGQMREIMEPEVFFLVSVENLPAYLDGREANFFAKGEVQGALFPASLCLQDEYFKDKSLGITGITSAQIARNMFREEENQ